jgi:hypothetical protein
LKHRTSCVLRAALTAGTPARTEVGQELSPEERLRFHQEHSRPLMIAQMSMAANSNNFEITMSRLLLMAARNTGPLMRLRA